MPCTRLHTSTWRRKFVCQHVSVVVRDLPSSIDVGDSDGYDDESDDSDDDESEEDFDAYYSYEYNSDEEFSEDVLDKEFLEVGDKYAALLDAAYSSPIECETSRNSNDSQPPTCAPEDNTLEGRRLFYTQKLKDRFLASSLSQPDKTRIFNYIDAIISQLPIIDPTSPSATGATVTSRPSSTQWRESGDADLDSTFDHFVRTRFDGQHQSSSTGMHLGRSANLRQDEGADMLVKASGNSTCARIKVRWNYAPKKLSTKPFSSTLNPKNGCMKVFSRKFDLAPTNDAFGSFAFMTERFFLPVKVPSRPRPPACYKLVYSEQIVRMHAHFSDHLMKYSSAPVEIELGKDNARAFLTAAQGNSLITLFAFRDLKTYLDLAPSAAVE